MSDKEKLEQRLLTRGVRDPVTGCLEWQGATNKNGYGVITISRPETKLLRVHRVSYELWVEPIEPGNVVCHCCDNPPCFEPSHLFQGTVRDNVLDAFAKGRRKAPPEFLAANPNKDKTHCIRGHPFDDKNTAKPKGGGRKCRKCHAEAEARRRAKNREA